MGLEAERWLGGEVLGCTDLGQGRSLARVGAQHLAEQEEEAGSGLIAALHVAPKHSVPFSSS